MLLRVATRGKLPTLVPLHQLPGALEALEKAKQQPIVELMNRHGVRIA